MIKGLENVFAYRVRGGPGHLRQGFFCRLLADLFWQQMDLCYKYKSGETV